MLVSTPKMRSWLDFRSLFDFGGARDRKNYIFGLLYVIVILFILAISFFLLFAMVNFFLYLFNYFLCVFIMSVLWVWTVLCITVQRLRHIGITDTFKQIILAGSTTVFPILAFVWMIWPDAEFFEKN